MGQRRWIAPLLISLLAVAGLAPAAVTATSRASSIRTPGTSVTLGTSVTPGATTTRVMGPVGSPTTTSGTPGGGTTPSPAPTSVTGNPGDFGFVSNELGSTPVGVTCPGPMTCTNIAAEPAIRADNAGNFYGSSENGIGAGTLYWKSSDAGQHYTYFGTLDSASAVSNTGAAPGGGDTDLAVAPDKNANGFYNVYVASLSLANVDVSTSMDGRPRVDRRRHRRKGLRQLPRSLYR